MSYDAVTFYLAADLAAAGTVTVNYPSGRSKGNYSLSPGRHTLIARGSNKYTAPEDFTLTFNANSSNITLTWGTGKPTLVAGSRMVLGIDRQGQDDGRPNDPAPQAVTKMADARVYEIDLGSPNAPSANAVALSQSVASTTFVLNGALVAGGVATFDVPRAVVAAWTNTAIITITGTDEYGRTMSEVSASGISHAGKKAFKTITSVSANASITGATVGTGDVLGLPVFLPSTALILKELEDGAAATAGTAVAGIVTKSTTSSGDVRGTYDPNSACDGSKGFKLIVALADPTALGVAQA